ncbi:MAG: phosphotransferase [Acidimicrobiia bacterium]|nr:phosphotransferase [Acidimicrobiia bacterium]
MREFPRERVAAVVGREPVRWVERGGGYTGAGRWVVEFATGPSLFVKASEGPGGAAIRREAAVLEALSGSFHPHLIGFEDDDGYAIEVIEDLSSARWPPPYPDDVGGLYDALTELSEHAAPAGLRALERPPGSTWESLERTRGWVGDLAVCSNRWLDASIDALVAAERMFDPTGDDLVHNDLWSGNIAFQGDRCVFIDWAEAHRGAAFVDTGFAMLSLRSEGFRSTTPRFDGDAAFASWWSASLASRLTRGVESWLDPTIEQGLHQDLFFALIWVSEVLDLPTPDGVDPR